MLSMGLCVASRFDGQRFERLDGLKDVFYCELKPISEQYEAEALHVNGLDRDRLQREGTSPELAMRDAASWIEERTNGHRPVLVAYPVAFDWSFLYWYFIRFAGQSPFGFSSCLDIRTIYQAQARTVFDRASQRYMPEVVHPRHEHTHHAADDALEQAELFNNLFEWVLGQPTNGHSGTASPPPPDWMKEFAL
jgi:DNA polymerase III epsilon subunit-like protein